MQQVYDLVLAGGTVVDPTSGRHEVADIGISGGRVAGIEPQIAETGERIDCRGAFVTPGLIDCHTHLFSAFTAHGVSAEEACLQRGVTVAADAGSAGCHSYAAFERYVVSEAPIRVYAFLNVSAIGMPQPHLGELRLLDYVDIQGALETARRYPESVKGFKVRLGSAITGGSCLPALKRARQIGDASRLPLMLHIGGSEEPLWQILYHLRPGDIVSHCFTGLAHGILDEYGLLPAVRESRAAGILFDPAHGSSNFSFAVARRALELGFLPDTISSDNSLRNWRGPVFDLATTMAKFLALGLTIDQVVERATIGAARMLGIGDTGAGRIAVDGPADLTVLRLTKESYELRDAAGEVVRAPRLEPLYTVLGGRALACVPWRGEQAAGASAGVATNSP